MSDGSTVEANTDQNEDIHDDSDVSFIDVVTETFKEHFDERGNITVSTTGLTSSAEGEDIWAYNDNGNLWSQSGNLPVTHL